MQEHLEHRFAERVDTRRLFRLLFEESGPRHADHAVEFLRADALGEREHGATTLQAKDGNVVERRKLATLPHGKRGVRPGLNEDVLHQMHVMQRIGDLRIVRRGWGSQHRTPHSGICPCHMTGKLTNMPDKQRGWLTHDRYRSDARTDDMIPMM